MLSKESRNIAQLAGGVFFFFICARAALAIDFPGFSSEEPKEEAEGGALQPIIVNGDVVEYSTESKDFSATGNVVVIYKGTKITCQKLTLNSVTKDCQAEGNVRMDDGQITIEGAKISYNFETKKGIIIDSQFRANPYFGRAEKQDKVSEAEFIALRGYMSTCSFDNPHYRMKYKKLDFFPGDKVQVKDSTFYAGEVPLLYLPQYNHSLKDPILQVQMMGGNDRDWGSYFLTAWRYSLTEDIKGRVYLDYRSNYGNAQGFAVNYDTNDFGRGDFKLYYTQERNKSRKEVDIEDVNSAKVFQRYLVRLRHKWDIDAATNVIGEYYKLVDSKRFVLDEKYFILKDYFPLEYQRDQFPLSYILFHRSSSYANLDVLFQARVNRWYSQEEKMPAIYYSLPSIKIFNTPFYFENSTSYVNYVYKHAVPSPSEADVASSNFAGANKFSLPFKVFFLNFTPNVSSSQSYSNKSTYGSTITNSFSGGGDLSTKFYRLFHIKSNFLGLDLNAVRHIITPTVSYAYTNSTTGPAGEMRIGGSGATRTSVMALEVDNKLQTKRGGQTVDLLDLRANSTYTFRTTGQKGRLSDIIFKLEAHPYSWMSFYADATYSHKNDYFTQASSDINFNFAAERSLGIGQRYNRGGSKNITYQMKWRFNPKWKVSFFHRINTGNRTVERRGLREQEYTITRDLHCWEMDFSYNSKRGEGENIWVVFRLKAFPELEFDFNRSYNKPKPGSQGYEGVIH